MLRLHEVIKPNLDGSLILPWPPSTNTLWRHTGNSVLISKKYRLYKRTIQKLSLFWRRKPLDCRISLHIKAYPPDKRKRDLDNILKGCIDSLQNAKLFLDDSQIDYLSIERMPSVKGGELHVIIKEIEEHL